MLGLFKDSATIFTIFTITMEISRLVSCAGIQTLNNSITWPGDDPVNKISHVDYATYAGIESSENVLIDNQSPKTSVILRG